MPTAHIDLESFTSQCVCSPALYEHKPQPARVPPEPPPHLHSCCVEFEFVPCLLNDPPGVGAHTVKLVHKDNTGHTVATHLPVNCSTHKCTVQHTIAQHDTEGGGAQMHQCSSSQAPKQAA